MKVMYPSAHGPTPQPRRDSLAAHGFDECPEQNNRRRQAFWLVNRHQRRSVHCGSPIWYYLSQVISSTLPRGHSWPQSNQPVDGLDREIEPGRHTDAPAVTQLSGQVVSLARADDSGGLRIEFVGGARLLAMPDSSFEAWTVAGPGRLKVVCGPGGELSVWSSQDS